MATMDLRWQSFLQDVGVRAKLTVGEMEIWQFQFDRSQARSTVTEIIKSLGERGFGRDNYKRIIGQVYDKLTDLGIVFEKADDKAVKVWEWLRQGFAQWDEERYGRSKLSKADLWGRLQDLGRYAPNRLGMFVAQESLPKMGGLPPNYRQPSPFLSEIPHGTEKLKFRVLQRLNQVLLLNRDESGTVVCMCPSELAISGILQEGELVVPDKDSKYAYLVPDLQWLRSIDGFVELRSPQLAELLSWVDIDGGEVLHTFFYVK